MTDPLPLWVTLAFTFLVAPLLALAGHTLFLRAAGRVLRGEHAPVLLRVLRGGRRAVAASLMLLAALVALPVAGLPEEARAAIARVLTLALTGTIGWALTRKMAAIFDVYIARASRAGEENLQARRRRTQLVVFRRVAVFTGIVLTLGLVLTAIPAVRAIGLSLFASAGVAGIVAGLAARPTVANLIAGLQLAVTQPVRIGDAVLIEGEWGHVDEIGSTYVTVATWDQRSLIVPLTWFLEKPIRNWTRASSQILDTVYLYADYGVPVEAIRQAARGIVEGSALWDGRVFVVQVTDLKERCMEVRILISAADAARMFDLRCFVRERLVAWMVREYPQGFAHERVEFTRPPRQG